MLKKIFHKEVKEDKKNLVVHEERPDDKKENDNEQFTQEKKKKKYNMSISKCVYSCFAIIYKLYFQALVL